MAFCCHVREYSFFFFFTSRDRRERKENETHVRPGPLRAVVGDLAQVVAGVVPVLGQHVAHEVVVVVVEAAAADHGPGGVGGQEGVGGGGGTVGVGAAGVVRLSVVVGT